MAPRLLAIQDWDHFLQYQTEQFETSLPKSPCNHLQEVCIQTTLLRFHQLLCRALSWSRRTGLIFHLCVLNFSKDIRGLNITTVWKTSLAPRRMLSFTGSFSPFSFITITPIGSKKTDDICQLNRYYSREGTAKSSVVELTSIAERYIIGLKSTRRRRLSRMVDPGPWSVGMSCPSWQRQNWMPSVASSTRNPTLTAGCVCFGGGLLLFPISRAAANLRHYKHGPAAVVCLLYRSLLSESHSRLSESHSRLR